MIRAATAGDAEAVLALWRAAGSAPTVTDDADSVRALVAHDPEALLVAEVDGAVVGSLIAAWDGWRGHLYRMAVHPDHRRQGIARALASEGTRRLVARGCRRIDAIVLREEADARAFWSAAGFHEQSDVTRWVEGGGVASELC
ncbi:MAG TPA: GNAT family N-acetyltransferase [Acidimicrobiales bacterium]